MSRQVMEETIKNALRAELKSGDVGDSEAQINRLASAISSAVYTHVTQELNTLKIVLSTPGTFVGAGVGTVVVTAPGMAAWLPGSS